MTVVEPTAWKKFHRLARRRQGRRPAACAAAVPQRGHAGRRARRITGRAEAALIALTGISTMTISKILEGYVAQQQKLSQSMPSSTSPSGRRRRRSRHASAPPRSDARRPRRRRCVSAMTCLCSGGNGATNESKHCWPVRMAPRRKRCSNSCRGCHSTKARS